MPAAPDGELALRESLRPLAWVRIGIGGIALLRTTPLAGLADPSLDALARPLLGWPIAADVASFGLSIPAPTVKALCIVRTLGLAAFALGLHARFAGPLAVAAGYLVLYSAPYGFTSTMHLLLQATLLLALVDSSCVLAMRREPARSPTTSRWLIRAFVASVYLWAGVAKLRAGWLDGHTLLLFHEEGRVSGPLANLLLATPRRCATCAVTIAFGEPAIGALLLVRRTRKVGLALALALHLGLEWMARPDVLGWAMLCLLMAFVERPPPARSQAQGRQ